MFSEVQRSSLESTVLSVDGVSALTPCRGGPCWRRCAPFVLRPRVSGQGAEHTEALLCGGQGRRSDSSLGIFGGSRPLPWLRRTHAWGHKVSDKRSKRKRMPSKHHRGKPTATVGLQTSLGFRKRVPHAKRVKGRRQGSPCSPPPESTAVGAACPLLSGLARTGLGDSGVPLRPEPVPPP